MSRRSSSSQPLGPSSRSPWMSAAPVRSPFLPHVIRHCRTCARLCAALAADGSISAEGSEALGDCAMTCGALVQLFTSGAAVDPQRALRTCAEDCRHAAEACRPGGSDSALTRQCEQACLECAALCDHERDYSAPP